MVFSHAEFLDHDVFLLGGSHCCWHCPGPPSCSARGGEICCLEVGSPQNDAANWSLGIDGVTVHVDLFRTKQLPGQCRSWDYLFVLGDSRALLCDNKAGSGPLLLVMVRLTGGAHGGGHGDCSIETCHG